MSELVVTLDDGRKVRLSLEPARGTRGLEAAIAQGATLGLADELVGAIAGPQAMQGMRENLASFRRESPYMATGMEMLGGLPTGVGVAAGLGRMAQTGGRLGSIGRTMTAPTITGQAGLGAAEGAVIGAASGETLAERLVGGVTGAGLGAVGGTVAAPISGALTRRFAPGREAEKLVTSAMRQDIGRTPTYRDFAELNLKARRWPERTLAELSGPTTEDLARTSARTPTGGARTLAEETLEARRRGSTDRLIAQLEGSTGSRESYWRNIEALEQQAKRDAGPLYDAARAAPFEPDADLMELAARGVDTGEIKAGYEAARRQARLREGKKIPIWKELTGEDGLGMEDLDLETWDWIKRGLDARYKKVVRQDPAMAAAIWDYRQQLVRKLDEMVPEYREARRLYAGPMEQREAQQAGRNIFKEDAEYTEDFISGMSQGEKDAYIVGAVQAIKDKLKSVPVEGGMPRFTQLAFDRLRNAFPDDEAADTFLNAVLGERDMQRFRNMILGGSPTADILTSQAQVGRTLGVAGGVGQILSGQPVEGARTIAANMTPRRADVIPPSINDPLSRILFARGPSGIPPVLQALERPAIMPSLLAPTITTEASILANQLRQRR